MNLKRYLISTIAVFIFIFIFDWVFHGNLLMDMYRKTADLWRPQDEMMGYFPLAVLFQILLAATLSFIFTRNYEGRGIGEGLRFGLYLGFLMGILSAGMYCYMPIPFALAGYWFVGGILLGLGSGIVLSFTYNND